MPYCPNHDEYFSESEGCSTCSHNKEMESYSGIDVYAKGDPMPQTIEAWERLYGLAEKAMLKDKAEIERLKQKVNRLEQRK